MGLIICLHLYFRKLELDQLCFDYIHCTSWKKYETIWDSIKKYNIKSELELFSYILINFESNHPTRTQLLKLWDFTYESYRGDIDNRIVDKKIEKEYNQFCTFKNFCYDFYHTWKFKKENDEWIIEDNVH